MGRKERFSKVSAIMRHENTWVKGLKPPPAKASLQSQTPSLSERPLHTLRIPQAAPTL